MTLSPQISAEARVASMKENFSGPSNIINAAKKAAGNAHGAWSRWVTAAITERLARENKMPADPSAELSAAIAEVGGAGKAVEILQAAQTPTRAKAKRNLRPMRRAA